MNFKAIGKFFGDRVHVWGCSSYTDHTGKVHDEFLPAKRLAMLEPIAKEVCIVAQSYDNRDEFYQDNIPTAVIFSEDQVESAS